ncbi:MAG TPA: DUF4290 domain-containing protein [Bacteroidetes bacterium]|nr:DUF4290 domain-containing protein [Bacteroidota bacterium]
MDRLLNIEYNSEKENLIISEYGRHIQDLINYAKTIEDPQEQQVFVEEIVELMKRMKIGNKKSPEYKEKIWMHVYKIANYELKAVPPTGEIPTPKPDDFKPQKLNYPTSEKHYRHYGHFIHLLMDKAIEMEDGRKKDEFVALIGAYMKLAYKTWSPEHFVNDKTIKEDLKRMTSGKLEFPEGYSLDILLDRSKERKPNNGKRRNMSKKKQKR